MRYADTMFIIAGALFGGGAICSAAGAIQHSNRALADKIAYSGLAAMGLVILFALVLHFWKGVE